MITWTPHGGANQQWQLTPNADGSYTLVNSASQLCADVNGGSTAAGAAVIQWTCTGADNQRWLFTPVTGGGYTIASKKSALLLSTASTADGALLTQQPAGGSALQTWQLA